ncbi:MAG: hypothetical protein IKP86_05050, partial [Anaerolineaceae bacterium]|nr:hypothetical protein [Anaerolineaceae bacterium]
GSFNTDDIYAIDHKRMEIGFLQESLKIDDACKFYEYGAICRGGCFRNRDKMLIGKYHSRFCSTYRMFFESCMLKLLDAAKRFVSQEYNNKHKME